MSAKHEKTAVAYLQGALHALDQAKAEGDSSRELSVAYTEIETALLWLERDVEFKSDENARPTYLKKRQPYNPPEFYDVEALGKLTAEERIGMFGHDPLEGEE
ncbi:hypothetical protein [Agrobacterium tumefaciens]|uniref:hypothetical protein n=1 Tax=Agrobacterium tumefaciens TaxID=358 RepID=UPI0015733CEE|nr:hypothetical protein [Agrobacterium tumefaciens]